MASTRRMEKAVDWTDDKYWAAWDKWDEVIDWGDEKSSPTTPPSIQAGTSTGDVDVGVEHYQQPVFKRQQKKLVLRMQIHLSVQPQPQHVVQNANDREEEAPVLCNMSSWREPVTQEQRESKRHKDPFSVPGYETHHWPRERYWSRQPAKTVIDENIILGFCNGLMAFSLS
ncbi:uncharacterized protein LOC125726516 isoform X2 [Brienomyrus brachyistius]|uniref:uncharacterized protein LOC125726516 isoform X2 n=1 Tax=Brienomyrus brachyistius TaxID=42636 RepID=UPI0020B24A9B|nr:uncharacterized protein LOC125726516 isoform X2 [Brienomyrus brachyistius]